MTVPVTVSASETDLTESQPVSGRVDIQLQHQLIDSGPLIPGHTVRLSRDIWCQQREPPPELCERHVLGVALLVEPERVQQLSAAQLRERTGAGTGQIGYNIGQEAGRNRPGCSE